MQVVQVMQVMQVMQVVQVVQVMQVEQDNFLEIRKTFCKLVSHFNYILTI